MLRTALSLSSLTGASFRIFNVRAGREQPGLKHQHVLGAKAVAAITGAKLEGAEPGSMTVEYLPGRPKPGRYSFSVGTAGSVGLIFQTVLLPLFLSGGPSKLSIRGGTHVPWCPVPDYLAEVFLPAIRPMGFRAEIDSPARGYYPGGGGSIEAAIQTAQTPLAPLNIAGRGRLKDIRITSAVSNLPISIAYRQLNSSIERLSGFSAQIHAESIEAPSPGRGTYLFILAEFENIRAGFTAHGARGKRAEAVGIEAAGEFLSYASKNGALDKHLSDQVLLYAALAKGESVFSTVEITRHVLTNIHVIEKFLPVRFQIDGTRGQEGIVSVKGASFQRA